MIGSQRYNYHIYKFVLYIYGNNNLDNFDDIDNEKIEDTKNRIFIQDSFLYSIQCQNDRETFIYYNYISRKLDKNSVGICQCWL